MSFLYIPQKSPNLYQSLLKIFFNRLHSSNYFSIEPSKQTIKQTVKSTNRQQIRSVVACEELEVDCHGECCNEAALAAETHLRCPGWVDSDTKCKVGADWCLETLYDNTWEYANSTGAAKQCPNYCPTECSWPEEMYCYEKNWDGCGKSVCVKADPLSMCPQNCPLSCSEFDIQCEGHYFNHTNPEMTLECYSGDYCIPMAYNYDGEIECPGVCYTHCDWEAGENYCPSYTADGCFAGNTCEKPGNYYRKIAFINKSEIKRNLQK